MGTVVSLVEDVHHGEECTGEHNVNVLESLGSTVLMTRHVRLAQVQVPDERADGDMGEYGVGLQQLRGQRHENGHAAQEAKHHNRLLQSHGSTAK